MSVKSWGLLVFFLLVLFNGSGELAGSEEGYKRPTGTIPSLSSWIDQNESGLFIFSCYNMGQSIKKTENH